ETAVDRGVKFELEILRTLKENVDMDFHRRKTGSASWPQLMKVTIWVTRPNIRWTICCERPSSLPKSRNSFELDLWAEITSGDNGVDIEGLFRNYFVVVQCKNRKGSVDILRDLEAVISRYPRNTIGILVIPCKANYTKNIKELKNLCKLF
ncbi:6677_t:CDS:2, partial [Entrophospora sp. SA101]